MARVSRSDHGQLAPLELCNPNAETSRRVRARNALCRAACQKEAIRLPIKYLLRSKAIRGAAHELPNHCTVVDWEGGASRLFSSQLSCCR